MENYVIVCQKLIEFIHTFPMPYKDIIQEQIRRSAIHIEEYDDCFIIHFLPDKDTPQLPSPLPTLLQGCQVLKESGPLVCDLFVESGYIVQFEVVDMGGNLIDWDYFWSHKPIFDVEYREEAIRNSVIGKQVWIHNHFIGQHSVSLFICASESQYRLCLCNAKIHKLDLPEGEHCCNLEIEKSKRDAQKYILKTHDDLVLIECDLVCLEHTLFR